MSRIEAIQIRCDRCKRVGTYAAKDVQKMSSGSVLKVLLDGKEELVFDDLCPDCKKAVVRIIDDLREWDRKIVQPFLGEGPTLRTGQAAPVQSAPDYIPPKPHAMGSR